MAMLFALLIIAQSVQASDDPPPSCEDLQQALTQAENNYQTRLDDKQEAYDAAVAAHNAVHAGTGTMAQLKAANEFALLKKSAADIALIWRDAAQDAFDACCDCACCPCGSTCGDPITTFQGVETRYWLSMEHFTPMLTQGPFVVSQLAGPANPPPGLEAHKGAWVVATEVDMAGLGKIRIETVDPTTLLAPHPNATVPPTTVDALTTMRLSVGGKQLAAGEHTLSMADATIAISAKRDPSTRRIGIGWVEQITIKADDLELRITSAKANKFADEEQQVLGLHLDVAFLTFDESAVRGALPEMWGLQPMSEDTKLLLGEKNVEN